MKLYLLDLDDNSGKAAVICNSFTEISTVLSDSNIVYTVIAEFPTTATKKTVFFEKFYQ